MLLEGRVQFKPLLLYGVMSLACWPLVRERAHPSFKSASTKGPGRGGTSHLTDFDETQNYFTLSLRKLNRGETGGNLTTPLVFKKKNDKKNT